MLTSNYISILRFIRDHAAEDISFDAIADKFGRPDSVSRLHYLEENHYTYYAGSFCKFVKISPKGLAVLDEYESARQKEADQRAYDERNQNTQNALQDQRYRKDARRSWVQWTITTVLSILSFFAGAVAEVLTGFMEWILAFLH